MIQTPPPSERDSEREEQRKQQGPSPLAPAPIDKSNMGKRLRRLVFGNPISSEHAEHTLLTKISRCPSSPRTPSRPSPTPRSRSFWRWARRACTPRRSSGDYTHYTMLITGLIVALLVIVVLSYWQTIFGYPSGGGSYIVSKDNLGALPGLIAAAALLIDYVLTVSVSIAVGRAEPGRHSAASLAALAAFRSSGSLVSALHRPADAGEPARPERVRGAVRHLHLWLRRDVLCDDRSSACSARCSAGIAARLELCQSRLGARPRPAETFGLVVLLRAFANGCSAMTGTEAVSNGIPAFQEPKSRNAALTLVAMGVILGTIFLGISALAMKLHVVYWEADGKTANAVIDQISGAVFGKTGHVGARLLPDAVLHRRHSRAGRQYQFCRLPAPVLHPGARPLPAQAVLQPGRQTGLQQRHPAAGRLRRPADRGQKRQRGRADPALRHRRLSGLHAVAERHGAFTGSSCGSTGWQIKAAINGMGAVATLLVLLDIAYEKFLEGAWVVMVLIVLLVLMFRKIHNHYAGCRAAAEDGQLSRRRTTPLKNTVLVLVPSLHRGVMPALEYARSLRPTAAPCISATDPEKTPQLRERWEQWGQDVPLVILNSPYRSLIGADHALSGRRAARAAQPYRDGRRAGIRAD